jgi:hypothetical protein
MAAIVPIDDYHKWQRLSKERVYAMLEEVWEKTRSISAEELQEDIEQALTTLRQELRNEQSSTPQS